MKWRCYKLISTTQLRWINTDDSWSDTYNHTGKIHQIVTWNDKILEPNHRLFFTARTGTDLGIIPWAGLRIASVSRHLRTRIRVGSGSHERVWNAATRNPTHELARTYTSTYIHTTYIRVQTCIHRLIHSKYIIYTYIRIICTYPHLPKHTHALTHAHTSTQ